MPETSRGPAPSVRTLLYSCSTLERILLGVRAWRDKVGGTNGRCWPARRSPHSSRIRRLRRNPRLSLDAGTGDLLRSAEQKLSRLDLAGEMVPSIDRFFYAFVRKEAVNKDRARPRPPENSSVTAARLLELLPRHPMVTLPAIVRLLNTSKPPQRKRLSVLERLRILKETTGRRRRSHLRLQRVPGATARGKTCSSPRATRTACQAPWRASWQALIRVTMRLRESRSILRRRDRRRGPLMLAPANGVTWKQFFLALKERFIKDKLMDVAGSVTFFGVLALFPFLLFLVDAGGPGPSTTTG